MPEIILLRRAPPNLHVGCKQQAVALALAPDSIPVPIKVMRVGGVPDLGPRFTRRVRGT